MKKIFSAALALVCIWFATPALAANCNLFDEVLEVGDMSNGTPVAGSNRMRSVNYISIEPATTYYLGATSNWHLWLYDNDKNFIREWSSIQNQNFTTPANAHYFKVSTYPNYGTTYLNDLIVTKGTTATAYTPYNPLCATCDGTIVNYVSATGTVSQSGTPTPDNPIYPTFYTQGNMILRAVGDYADSYDATTGKITRRVGVAVLDGTERWGSHASNAGWFQLAGDVFPTDVNTDALSTHYMQYTHNPSGMANQDILFGRPDSSTGRVVIRDAINFPDVGLADDFKSWLAQQYAAGTPVTVWYPLRTETTEDWPASYCETPIKIATTKYNETAFSPLNTALQNAISVVDTVVSNTITQAGRIATLQTQKQTRPADDPSDANNAENCPAGKKCLLVEDASGVPHWYEIVTSRLPDGYTELEYIESTGTQWIDTGIVARSGISSEIKLLIKNTLVSGCALGANSGNQFHATFWYNGGWDSVVGGDNVTSAVQYNTPLVATFKSDTDGYKFYVDGVLTNYGSVNTTGSLNLFLFKRNGSGSQFPMYGNMYYAKIWENDTLVRDFVPAKNPDGKIGMYDLANGVFYENKGTGTFIGGQPVFN